MTASLRTAVAEHAVADVEDLDAALADDSVSPPVRHRLTEVRQRRLAEVPGVPVTTAARILGLSPQSVRAWLQAGVLDPMPGSAPLKVATDRLAEVASLVHQLRQAGHDHDLLRVVVDRLEDDRVTAHPRVRLSLDQLHHGHLEPFSAADL